MWILKQVQDDKSNFDCLRYQIEDFLCHAESADASMIERKPWLPRAPRNDNRKEPIWQLRAKPKNRP